jgi:hypothetical protein
MSFTLASAAALVSWLAAAPGGPIIVLDDPRGDDTGAGALQYPTNQDYRAGDFDLRRVEVAIDGAFAVVSVTFGARVQKPATARRSLASEVELTNGLYVQNVDVYIDHTPGVGFTEALPGRNVTIDPDGAWDSAIVLTPQPFLTRPIVESALPRAAADHVWIASDVRSFGATAVARVPLAALGGAPKPSWGFVVLLTGAIWDNSFAAVNRLVGSYEPNAFTMPVYAIPEGMAFGSGRLDRLQPRVVDLVAPAGRTQASILGAWSGDERRRAVVPMVYVDGEAHAREVRTARATADAAAKQSPKTELPGLAKLPGPATSTGSASAALGPVRAPDVLTIASVDGPRAVIPLAAGVTVNPWALGTVLDVRGETIARVVATAVFPGFVLATAVEGEKGLRPGLHVTFAAATPAAVKPEAPVDPRTSDPASREPPREDLPEERKTP